VVSPHSVSFFSCPDKYLPLPSSARGWPSLDHFLLRLIEHSPTLSRRCLDSIPRLALCGGLSHCPLPCIRLALQRLGCCSGGFLSPASRPDAGGALGRGKCSARDRQRSVVLACQRPRDRLPSHLCWGSQPCQQARGRQDIPETQVRLPLLATLPSFPRTF